MQTHLNAVLFHNMGGWDCYNTDREVKSVFSDVTAETAERNCTTAVELFNNMSVFSFIFLDITNVWAGNEIRKQFDSKFPFSI